jgi:stearoyl-CoA desaturase (delta-9 desaturase)
MNKLNWYFYKVWLPLHLLAFSLLFLFPIDWSTVLIGWVIFGPLATGVGLHRLFAHRSFETHPWIENILAYLATLSAYAPILFWVSQHQYHHQHSDRDQDPTSPKHRGFLYSFLYWRFLNSNLKKTHLLNYCSKKIIKSPILMWFNNNFTMIIWIHVLILFLISPTLLLSIYLIPMLLESTRVNILNSLSHIDNIPFSYRNYDTPDKSYNNLIIGYLSMGFGWHNNHHYNPKKNIVQDRWWELDIEGYIGYLLSKFKSSKD